MSEIEITLPTVQYGNVKVRATPEELGMNLADAGAIGHGIAIYLNLFTQGFNTGFVADVEWSPQEAASAPVSAPQEAPGPKVRTINEILSDEDVETVAEARAILDKELGGVTELPEETVTHVDTGLDYPTDAGAPDPHAPDRSHHFDPTEGYDLADRSGDAPWDKPAVDAKPKPWETDAKEKLAVQTAEW